MIYKRRNIGTDLENYIIQLYSERKSLEEIQKLSNVSINTLMNLLGTNYSYFTRDDYTSFKTYGERILIIADTHVGSKYENLKYIDEAYNTGIDLGVSSCIHLGDIIQG